MAKKGGQKIVRYDPYTGQPIYESPSGGGRGAIKGVLIALIVVALGAGGWFVYDTFFNFTEVDLFVYWDELQFNGYSGEGWFDDSEGMYYDGDWIGEPAYTADFYNSIYYTFDKTDGLSNGDVVTVTVSYDKAAARKCKVKVKSDTKQYTVEGLRERYKSDLSDMDPEELSEIKSYMDDYMARYALERDYDLEGMVKLYYIAPSVAEGWDYETDEEIYEDQIVAVYKAYYTWFDETETEYLVVTLSPIDKSYDYTQIDTLISNDMLDIDAYYSGEDLNEVLEEITTEHNRDTVTALSI